jgi:hypothetical protein
VTAVKATIPLVMLDLLYQLCQEAKNKNKNKNRNKLTKKEVEGETTKMVL